MSRTFGSLALKVSCASLALGAAAWNASEARAACIGGDSTCATFDPTTISTPTLIGGLTGTFTPPSGAKNTLTKAKILFEITNFVSPFTLTGISLTGDGITTSLSFTPVSITGDGSFETDFVNLNTTISYPNSLAFANSRLSFSIPAGLAVGTQIDADIRYTSSNGSRQVATTGTSFTTLASLPRARGASVPGPLPLLGAGAAFGFSRKLRHRIKLGDQA
jgi:hypothetical protein